MPTPISAASSYCTPAQFIQLYDVRRIGDLALDVGLRAEAETITSGAGLPADSVIQFFLDRAAGEVEAAIGRGQNYTPTHLAALTGVSKQFLVGLVADIAYYRLSCRRNPEAEPTEAWKLAKATLKAISDGEEVFGLVEKEAAGLPANPFATRADIKTQSLITYQGKRLFGTRANQQLPGG